MHGIAILWHVRVLLSMCRHHISRKMHTDNKMKGEKSQQTKIEMENRQHQACSYIMSTMTTKMTTTMMMII